MAIQQIDLKVPNGDTPRSANTKINANFSDQTHAASKLVGIGAEQLPLTKYTFRAAMTVSNLTTGLNLPYDYDTAKVGDIVYTDSALNRPLPSYQVGYCLLGHQGGLDPVQLVFSYLGVSRFCFRGSIGMEWAEVYTDKNTTKDSNGFIKAASPIVKVFADKVELNGEAVDQDVSYKKNGIGDYTITTVSGLSTDGWYIELPKDMNGNPKVAVTLSEVDGVISLKTYRRIFSMETFTFEPDLDNPLDVPEGRWIDLRLNEIPAEEVNP